MTAAKMLGRIANVLTVGASLLVFCGAEFSAAAQPTNDPYTSAIARSGIYLKTRLVPTARYEHTVVQMMIKKASQAARRLNLSEPLPIFVTNVQVFLQTPAMYVHTLRLGTLETANYGYFFDAGLLSGFDQKVWTKSWRDAMSQYKGPKVPLNTNFGLNAGYQLMRAAGINVGALDRDCRAEVDAVRRDAMAVYTIRWNISGTNVLYDDWPDQNSARAERAARGKIAARLRFVEPIHDIERIVVFDPKYIVQDQPMSLNMFELLTPENSPEHLSAVMNLATNAQPSIEIRP